MAVVHGNLIFEKHMYFNYTESGTTKMSLKEVLKNIYRTDNHTKMSYFIPKEPHNTVLQHKKMSCQRQSKSILIKLIRKNG